MSLPPISAASYITHTALVGSVCVELICSAKLGSLIQDLLACQNTTETKKSLRKIAIISLTTAAAAAANRYFYGSHNSNVHLGVMAIPFLIASVISVRPKQITPSVPREVKDNTENLLLSDALVRKAQPYADDPQKIAKLPRAGVGKTPVYFLDELVLKKSGSPQNQKRFEQMKQAHQICQLNGYEDIVIPKAGLYRDFIFESKLPITCDIKRQVGLYVENRNQFTNTAREFTGFLFQSDFHDLLSGRSPYLIFSKIAIRYDNLPLYLEEGRGKIGLVDLEQFSPADIPPEAVPPHKAEDTQLGSIQRISTFCSSYIDQLLGDSTQPHKSSDVMEDWKVFFSKRCLESCRIAITFFPYHFDTIMSVAKKFAPNVEDLRKELEEVRDETLKFFKLAYEDHRDFIIAKGITLENPAEFKWPEASIRKQIQDGVGEKLRNFHEDKKKILGQDPDKTLSRFNETFPEIIDATCTCIEELLKSRPSKSISSMDELLSRRSCEGDIPSSIWSPYLKSITPKLNCLLDLIANDLEEKRRDLINMVVNYTLEEFANLKVIAYYNPKFGFGERQRYIYI